MRKIYLTILLIGLVCLCGSYSFANDTSQALVIEGRALLFNNGTFTYSGTVAANVKFGQAVAADPSDQEANLFYAVTRVGAFALEQGSGSGLETLRDLYEAFGVTRNSNDSLPDSPVDLPPAFPDTAPDGEPVRAFLAGPFVDLLDDALANLSVVTSLFTTTITAAETGDMAVEVDYGDVLLLRSAFYVLKGLFLFVSSYDLDIDLHDIMAKCNMGVFQVQRDLLDEYPDLLKLRSTDGSASLTSAKQALINGIDAYREAYEFIASESDFQGDDLFFFGSLEEQDEANDLLTQLTEAEDSLNQNRATAIGDTNIDFNLVFGNTGKSQLDIRSVLPEFDEDDDILAGTFPSPILNGIFPDITTEKDLAQAADLKLVYDVPTGLITLDGNSSDWSGITHILDDDSEQYAPAHGDIESVSMARDNTYLYWMMTIYDPPSANDVLYNTDFSISRDFDEWDFPQYDSQVFKDQNGNHYWLHSHYQGQITTISQDPEDVGIGDVIEARLPLSLFDGHVKLSIRSWTELAGIRDYANKAFLRLPSGTVSGTLSSSVYNGTGHIFIWAYDGADPNTANVFGETVINSTGAYTIEGLPIGTNVYLYALWDADDNGIISGQDYVSGVSGPHNISSSGIIVNIDVNSPIPTFSLTVTKSGTGSGTITSNPASIDCGSTCSAQFAEDAEVSLTATPDAGTVFVGWGGDCASCGTDSSCQITMDTDMTCTASFNNTPGDANGDTNINVQDVICIINVILDTGTASGSPDCNEDRSVNVQDVICVINKILGG